MKMKNILLAGAAGVAGISSANAADMAVKAPPPPVIPAPTWAGFYIGGNIGVAQVEVDRFDTFGFLDQASGKKTGFIGGGQIGYNWQSGTFVYGLEADASWLSAKQNFNCDRCSGLGGEYGNKVNWLATARARMGLAVGDTLAYVTAGVAWANVNTRSAAFVCCTTAAPNGGLTQYSQSKTRTGWVAGAGIEHMINRNWTIAMEGLFVDLGSKTYSQKGAIRDGLRRVDAQAIIGRFKVNYKF